MLLELTSYDLAHLAITKYGAMQKVQELSTLIEFLKGKKLESVVEIGSGNGGTFWLWTKLAEDGASIHSIDLPTGDYGGNHAQGTMATYGERGQRTSFYAGSSKSQGAWESIKNDYNLLFIDGDHSFQGVQADFEKYSPLAEIVVLHDICEHPPEARCEVSKFWEQIKLKYPASFEIKCEPTTWGGIGVLVK